MSNMRGKFISFEGIDGSGKSTAMQVAVKYLLEEHGIYVCTIREPGSTDLGEKIRNYLLSNDNTKSVKTEFLLMYAARQENVDRNLCPTLARGRWVLADRFHDSTYAYQGAHNIDEKDSELFVSESMFAAMERMVVVDSNCLPDVTFYLDISAEKSLTRLSDRKLTFFESLGTGYMERVRQRYLKLARYNDRFEVIDATKSIEEVHADIKDKLDLVVQEYRDRLPNENF